MRSYLHIVIGSLEKLPRLCYINSAYFDESEDGFRLLVGETFELHDLIITISSNIRRHGVAV